MVSKIMIKIEFNRYLFLEKCLLIACRLAPDCDAEDAPRVVAPFFLATPFVADCVVDRSDRLAVEFDRVADELMLSS